LRTFIAVDVLSTASIASVQKEIAIAAGWTTREVKAVEPENFHFTLIFLGEITDTDVANVQSSLSGLRFDSFEISYKGVGGFPRSDAAKVIWVGVDKDGAQKLSDLAGRVAGTVSELGFRPDKPFSPHLTIFRTKDRRPVNLAGIAEEYDNIIATDRIDRMHLKKSELKQSGPIYSNVYTIEAGK
jgi:2'-5' RNA ligase